MQNSSNTHLQLLEDKLSENVTVKYIHFYRLESRCLLRHFKLLMH